MARATPSDEQVQLRRRARRRLIGAVALAIVIAVVLPWVLEGEPRPSENEVSIQIPSPDSTRFDPRLPGKDAAPKPGDEGESNATGKDKALRADDDKTPAAPSRPRAKDKDKPASAAAEPKKAAGAHASAAQKQYVVQIAALADSDKALNIQQELAAKGLEAYTEKVASASGGVTRVRVGPFPSREAAEKERARLKSLGFEGNVTPR